MRTVIFFDWFYGSSKELGRLGITCGEKYQLDDDQLFSITRQLFGAGLAVMVYRKEKSRKKGEPRSKNREVTFVAVSNHKGSSPFGQLG